MSQYIEEALESIGRRIESVEDRLYDIDQENLLSQIDMLKYEINNLKSRIEELEGSAE